MQNAPTVQHRTMDVAEVAKVLRKRLRAEFPGVKFSVRSSRFSMGTSVDVSWTDGPTTKTVDAILDHYRGGDFDGFDDSYSHRAPIGIGGEYVRSGAKFVSANRTVSADTRRVNEKLAAAYFEVPAIDPNGEYQLPGRGLTVFGSQVGAVIAEDPGMRSYLAAEVLRRIPAEDRAAIEEAITEAVAKVRGAR